MEEYAKHVNIVGDPVSETFVTAAVTVWDRALYDAGIMKAVMAAGEAFGKRSPFDHYSKLDAIIKRAHDIKPIRFCFEGMYDLALSGAVDLGDFSFRNLTGPYLGFLAEHYLFVFVEDNLSNPCHTWQTLFVFC